MTARTVLLAVFAAAALTGTIALLRRGEAPRRVALNTPPSRPTLTPERTPTATPALPAYRLAGIVIAPEGYAVVEAPEGGSGLYRIGQSVPGLGRLVEVGPGHATFQAPSGKKITLHVQPAVPPTATPALRIRDLLRRLTPILGATPLRATPAPSRGG